MTIKSDKILAATVDILRSLKLHKIPKDWVASIWESQFTDSPSLDAFDGKRLLYRNKKINFYKHLIELFDDILSCPHSYFLSFFRFKQK